MEQREFIRNQRLGIKQNIPLKTQRKIENTPQNKAKEEKLREKIQQRKEQSVVAKEKIAAKAQNKPAETKTQNEEEHKRPNLRR